MVQALVAKVASYPWKYLRIGAVLAATGCAAAHVREPGDLALNGEVYFTNNTPRDLATFPVELYTPDRRRRIAATTLNADGEFTLTGIEPGNYLLSLTWAARPCTLWYRVNLARGPNRAITIIMDAACAHGQGLILDPYSG